MKHITLLIACVVFNIVALAQAGTLDLGFGNGGIITAESYRGRYRDLLIQKDGKIIAAGEGGANETGGFLFARYNVDGTPDLSYGTDGLVITSFPNAFGYHFRKAVMFDNDKVIAVGEINILRTDNNLVLAMYNNNGTLDSGFGINGIVTTQIKNYESPSGVAVQNDGKIIVGGLTQKPGDLDNGGDFNAIFILRYMPDGTIDNSFANNGLYKEMIADPIDVQGFALQPDGKILIGGEYLYSRQQAFFVKRYTTQGAPDTDFGTNGEAIGISNTHLNSLFLQNDGRILAAGYTYIVTDGFQKRNAIIAQLNADGSINTQFGNNGYTMLEIPDRASDISDLAIQTDGKIVAATNNYEPIRFDDGLFGASRYTANGKLDSSYGTNGIVSTLTGFVPHAYAIVLQKDDKAIIGGYTILGNPPRYTYPALVRYNGDQHQQHPRFVKIKKWLHRHGFTWDDFPGRNISYYAVQRSSNGNNFTEIARLFNRNNQQQLSYADAAPLTGDNYYRLAAVSADGAVTYSNVLAIPNNNTTAIKIYPNPAKNNLQIEGLSATEKTKLIIADLNGVARMSTVANSSSYNWNISNLKPGNYILRITNGSNVVTKKFLKE